MVDQKTASLTGDIGSELSTLRSDVSRLAEAVSSLVRHESSSTGARLKGAVDNVKSTMSSAFGDASQTTKDLSAQAHSRVLNWGGVLETNIERNPLTAVLIAGGIGLLVGMLSRGRD